MEQGSAVGGEGSYSTASIERGEIQLEREGRSWCTVREGGEELVYSKRGGVELVYS